MEKIVVIVLEGEILSAFSSEGITKITNSESSVYIDTKQNLITLLNSLKINDLSKLEEL